MTTFQPKDSEFLDIDGAAFWERIDLAPADLFRAFGEPENGSDDDKTTMEWWFEGSDGTLYSLYDMDKTAEDDITISTAVPFHIGVKGGIGGIHVPEFVMWVKSKTAPVLPDQPAEKTKIYMVYLGERPSMDGKPAHVYHKLGETLQPFNGPLDDSKYLTYGKPLMKGVQPGNVIRFVADLSDGRTVIFSGKGNEPEFIENWRDHSQIVEWSALHRACILARRNKSATNRQMKAVHPFDRLVPFNKAYHAMHTAAERQAFLAFVIETIVTPPPIVMKRDKFRK